MGNTCIDVHVAANGIKSAAGELNLLLSVYINYFIQQPVPSWIKLVDVVNRKSIMYKINDSYGQIVGILPEQYKFKEDSCFFDAYTSSEYLKHDLHAISTGKPEAFIETWKDPISGDTRIGKFVLKKELRIQEEVKTLFGDHNLIPVIGQLTGITDANGNDIWPIYSKDT